MKQTIGITAFDRLNNLVCLIVSGTLGLVLGNAGSRTADLEFLVLGFLDGLSRVLLLLGDALAHHAVLWLELDHGVLVVVDEAESGGLATSELGAESEDDGELGVGLVHASQQLAELALGNIGASWMDHINDHLIL